VYDWPGNLTQLESVVKSTALLASSPEIGLLDVNSALSQLDAPFAGALSALPLDVQLREARDAFERLYLEYHIAREGANMSKVADRVGLERTHLYRKLKQLGIKIGLGLNENKMPPPPRPIVSGLDDPRAIQPAMQRKADEEPILTRIQASETDSGDADEPCLLRDDLNLAEGLQHCNVFAREIQSGWRSVGEQSIKRKLPARVPQVAAYQSGSAARANPQPR